MPHSGFCFVYNIYLTIQGTGNSSSLINVSGDTATVVEPIISREAG